MLNSKFTILYKHKFVDKVEMTLTTKKSLPPYPASFLCNVYLSCKWMEKSWRKFSELKWQETRFRGKSFGLVIILLNKLIGK